MDTSEPALTRAHKVSFKLRQHRRKRLEIIDLIKPEEIFYIYHENVFCDTAEQADEQYPDGDEDKEESRGELMFHIEVEKDQPEGDKQEW